MSIVNEARIWGHIGSDPKISKTKGGQDVAEFSVATKETWKDAEGVKKEHTEWHQITVYGPLAVQVGKYYKKGAAVMLRGQLRTERWEDKDGNKKSITKIIAKDAFLTDKRQDMAAPLDEETQQWADDYTNG
ncbi:single-stranded DNA-binding protein [Comamonadaceae bacterium OH2310_COT-174]|nr:single-stranded DNA-binding protein [Comamonadaceae bacterium OH2310_COT-174]